MELTFLFCLEVLLAVYAKEGVGVRFSGRRVRGYFSSLRLQCLSVVFFVFDFFFFSLASSFLLLGYALPRYEVSKLGRSDPFSIRCMLKTLTQRNLMFKSNRDNGLSNMLFKKLNHPQEVTPTFYYCRSSTPS